MFDQNNAPQVTHFQTTPSLPLPGAIDMNGLEAPAPVPQAPPPTQPPLADDSLLEIKQQALASLTPLVGRLDQSPEEKFKTTMMLIQASDNSALLRDAYAVANQISDEKARAQALIDVVNEINYFTQKNAKSK